MTAALAASAGKRPISWEQAGRPDQIGLRWVGDERVFYKSCLRYGILIVLTLGLSSAWAKVELRRKIWSSIKIDGEPVRYTGNVAELLMPYVMGLAAFAGLLILLLQSATPDPVAINGAIETAPKQWRYLSSLTGIFGLGLLNWRARRLLLRNTELAVTASHNTGSGIVYAASYLATSLMTVLTFGLASPWRQCWLQRYFLNDARLGAHRLQFQSQPRGLFARFAVVWVTGFAAYGTFVAMVGLIAGSKILHALHDRAWPSFSTSEWLWMALSAAAAGFVFACVHAWYKHAVLTHTIAGLYIDGRPMRLEGNTWDFAKLTLSNGLLKLMSLGFLSPIAEARALVWCGRRIRLAPPVAKA